MAKVNHPKTRRFQLSVDKIETLEDVKKILDVMNIRIDTNNPKWDDVGDYFEIEVIPRGYLKLLAKIGHEKIAEMDYNEIARQATDILQEEEIKLSLSTNEEN